VRAGSERGSIRRDALIEAVREANATLDPRKVAEWLARQAQEWIPAPCWVVIAHDLNGHLNVLADAGLVPSLGPSLWSSANWVMRHGTSFSPAISPRLAQWPGRRRLGCRLSAPLSQSQRRRARRPRSDTIASAPSMGPSLVLALRAFLEPTAIALDNALALQKAEALSVTDDLTRLSNSRYLNIVLRRETKRAVRNARPLSLLFLDLDSFKQCERQARPPRWKQSAGGSGGGDQVVLARNRRGRPVRRRRVLARAA
jgi:hypothetical protein